MGANKTPREKAKWELNKNARYCFEQILEATPHKTAAVWPLTSHLKKPLKQDVQSTVGKARTNS